MDEVSGISFRYSIKEEINIYIIAMINEGKAVRLDSTPQQVLIRVLL